VVFASERGGHVGKIVSNFYISLDGVVEAPETWQFQYFNDQVAAAAAGTEKAQAFLMGRRQYEEWVEYWPSRGTATPAVAGEPEDAADSFASFINDVPKYVVSNTLSEATWNNTTVLPADPTRIQELRDTSDGEIAMFGSATTVRWLLANGLIDELHLMLHPIAVGRGQRLFEDSPTYPLQLVKHEAFTTGVLDLTYAPANH
jgi:dihydrofolate reductase